MMARLGHLERSAGVSRWLATLSTGALGRALLRTLMALVLSLMLPATATLAQQLQPVPPLTGHVMDRTGLLSADQRQSLESQLQQLESDLGTQMVVLLVSTTQPEDIAAYAQRVGDTWKIGRRQVGDGLLVVVASQDRRVRIEVAKSLEGAVPDLAAKRIIDQDLTPAFKQGHFAAGLSKAVTSLRLRIAGEALPLPPSAGPAPQHTPATTEELDWPSVALIAFVGALIVSRVLGSLFGRWLGGLGTGGVLGFAAWTFTGSLLVALGIGLLGLFAGWMLGGFGGSLAQSASRHGPVVFGPGGGWGGGGFGGSSGGGGGFSSGGGGDFGGGGASGDW